jgi:hypothetical protein
MFELTFTLRVNDLHPSRNDHFSTTIVTEGFRTYLTEASFVLQQMYTRCVCVCVANGGKKESFDIIDVKTLAHFLKLLSAFLPSCRLVLEYPVCHTIYASSSLSSTFSTELYHTYM